MKARNSSRLGGAPVGAETGVRFGAAVGCHLAPAFVALAFSPLAIAQTVSPALKDSGAAPVMQIRKEVPGDFIYQFRSRTGDASSPTALPAGAVDAAIPLALPSGFKRAGAVLDVLDGARGNAARIPVNTSSVTPLTEASFTLVQVVKIPVQSKGRPATAVQVTLSSADGKYKSGALLEDADAGVATFRNVPLGQPVTASVSFGPHPPQSETRTLTRDHPAGGYEWAAIVVDWTDVKTVAAVAARVAPSAAVSGASGDAANRNDVPVSVPPAPNPIAGIVSDIVSLVALVAIGYGIYWAYTTGRLKVVLDQLGINVAPIADPAPGSANPFTKQERKPVQPITEGTAEPVLDGAAGGAAVMTAYSAPGSPRLVGTMGSYSGQIFAISAGSMDIGRDPGNGIALPQDVNTSRRHATLVISGGQCTLIDNGSANGTFINGVRIPSQAPQPLRGGDEVQIGQTRFRFEA